MIKELNILKAIQNIFFELNKHKCIQEKKAQILNNCIFFHDSQVYVEVISEIVKEQNVVVVPVLPKSSGMFKTHAFPSFAYLFTLTLKHPEWTFYIHSLEETKVGTKFVKLYVENNKGEEVKNLEEKKEKV